MSEEQAEYITDALEMMGKGYDHPEPERAEGFNSPNYTQSPNDFYDHYLRQIDTLAELKVVSAFIRFTFGYHRDAFRMGIDELADYTGMSGNSVRAGAEAAERRKLLRRINPTSNRKAEWELYIAEDRRPQKPEGGRKVGKRRPSKFEGQAPQSLKGYPSKVEGLSGVKERIKKESKDINEEEEGATPAPSGEVFRTYEHEIGVLTPHIADELQEAEAAHGAQWVCAALKIASENGKRNWKYAKAILGRWKAEGYGSEKAAPKRKQAAAPAPTNYDRNMEILQGFMERRKAASNG